MSPLVDPGRESNWGASAYNVGALRRGLKERGLSTEGTKPELQGRLTAADLGLTQNRIAVSRAAALWRLTTQQLSLEVPAKFDGATKSFMIYHILRTEFKNGFSMPTTPQVNPAKDQRYKPGSRSTTELLPIARPPSKNTKLPGQATQPSASIWISGRSSWPFASPGRAASAGSGARNDKLAPLATRASGGGDRSSRGTRETEIVARLHEARERQAAAQEEIDELVRELKHLDVCQ